FRNGQKVKCGLAPTGVFRQMLVTTQQFPDINIRPGIVKDKPRRRGKPLEFHLQLSSFARDCAGEFPCIEASVLRSNLALSLRRCAQRRGGIHYPGHATDTVTIHRSGHVSTEPFKRTFERTRWE